MSWPLASHFSAMLQNPRLAFRDPQLKQVTVEKDARGQPRPWAGAFAVVYKAYNAGTGEPFAVRVFTTESPERRERYDLLSAYLKGRKPNCLVEFEYRDRSIRSASDGKWYPMILMEWVDGQTLFKWARAACLSGNRAAIAAVAERWVRVVGGLQEAAVSHGDLQHANVMVTPAGELKLVDYDCMCVPALVGRRNLEVGVEPYQHPSRNETTLLSLDLDNFSALVIYVALRALSADPALWQKYVEGPGYDKLLFRSEDFQNPVNSALYHDLLRSPDQELRDLTQQLFGLAHAQLDQVPPLGQLADSYAKVQQLLEQRQWQAAVQWLNRRGQFRDAPARLRPLIRRAYEEVCREDAWAAFCKVTRETSEANDRHLVEAWNEELFTGFEPAERERVRVAEARRRVAVLDRLNHLVQAASGARTLETERQIVRTVERLPQGYQYMLRQRVEHARRRVAALERLERAITQATSEAAIVAAWRAVVELKCDAWVNPDWRPRVGLAERRAPLLKSLHELPGDLPAPERDRRLLDLWQHDLLEDCREADRWRGEYEAARARRQVLDKLEDAIARYNDEAVLALIEDPCLAGYALPETWYEAIDEARRHDARLEALLAALRENRRETFPDVFDARLIRRYPDRFESYRDTLRKWTIDDVLSLERLGLGPVRSGTGIEAVEEGGDSEQGEPAAGPAKGSGGDNGAEAPDGPGEPEDTGEAGEEKRLFRVRWTWPSPRFADRCRLALTEKRPGAADDPEDVAADVQLDVDRATWQREGGACALPVEPAWLGRHVVVWAVIDLGFQQFHSPPLVVGKLEARSRWWKGFGLFGSRRKGKDTHDEPPAAGSGDEARAAADAEAHASEKQPKQQ